MASLTSDEANAPTTEDMREVQNALAHIRERVDSAVLARGGLPAQLVVVSKTKPVPLLQAAYDAGARLFGENYVQELIDKAPMMPPDVRWHFIGTLQSKKAKKLVNEVPNLSVVETVDSLKLAKLLNDAAKGKGKVLDIYLQINTSGEDTKSGTGPAEASALAIAVQSQCPNVSVKGLMTIGAPGDLSCFDTLVGCRVAVAAALGGIEPESLALSMGMSGDFEEAIARGATSVRVGSSVFGARVYPNHPSA